MFKLFFSRNKFEKENTELKETIEWYKKEWKKSTDVSLVALKSLKEDCAVIEKLKTQYAQALKVISAYHLWDPILLATMKTCGIPYPFDKGPATMYLEEMGVIQKTEQTNTDMEELKNVQNIKGKN